MSEQSNIYHESDDDTESDITFYGEYSAEDTNDDIGEVSDESH